MIPVTLYLVSWPFFQHHVFYSPHIPDRALSEKTVVTIPGRDSPEIKMAKHILVCIKAIYVCKGSIASFNNVVNLTQYGLVMQYGETDLDQHWLR